MNNEVKNKTGPVVPKILKRISRIVGKTGMWILFAANIVLLILLGLAFLAWYIPPYQNVVPSYLGLVFLVLVSMNVLFMLMWVVFLKWKFALVGLIILALCWSPISTYLPLHMKQKALPEDCIKVMTYNVMGFNWETDETARQNPIFDYVSKSGADIICMQEFVINNSGYNPSGIISIREIDRILADYPYRSIVRFGRAEGVYSFGIACYSKFPIEKTVEIPLNSEFNGAAMHQINVKGKKINLINCHLESNRITAEDKLLYQNFITSGNKMLLDSVSQNIQERLGTAYIKRGHQADIISSWVKNQGLSSVIVCGDFNDTPISYTYKTVLSDNTLIDSFKESGLGQGISYNRNMFWFRIDYIMHSKNMKSYNSSIDKVMFSDHYPLTTYLQIE